MKAVLHQPLLSANTSSAAVGRALSPCCSHNTCWPMTQADRNNSRLAHRPGMPFSSNQRSGHHITPLKLAANSSAMTGNNSERELVAVTECPILGRRRESLRGCEKAASFVRGMRQAHFKKWTQRAGRKHERIISRRHDNGLPPTRCTQNSSPITAMNSDLLKLQPF